MKKVKLEFTLRQANAIFEMMDEGSVGVINNHETYEEYADARVCRNAIASFEKQIWKLNSKHDERTNANNK